jgi:uncharacterized phage protein (TIGR02220 family)
MHRGYVKLWRKVRDNPLWTSEKFSRGQAWVDLIMLANHKKGFIRKRGIKIEVERGEVGWSERQLAERWQWSRGKVRRFLIDLCLGDFPEITRKTIPQKKFVTSLIVINNYDLYQSDGPQTDRKRTANGTRTRMIKNDKNIYCAFPIKKIVEYLNQKTGSKFKPTSRTTQALIKARFNEGAQESDFYQVIDNKAETWANNAKMVKFLRPQTLFGNKFEAYLNETRTRSANCRPMPNPSCVDCKMSASNMERGKPCPWCGGHVE